MKTKGKAITAIYLSFIGVILTTLIISLVIG